MDFVLPDIQEGDTDLASLSSPLPNFKEIKPGTPEWEASEAAIAAAKNPEPEEDKFPPDIDQDLRGLMFLGSLQNKFALLGHDIVLKTLKTGEELACMLLIKEYEETLGTQKAFASAFVAASIVSIDGQAMMEPMGPEQAFDVLRQRFTYVIQSWYWPVIEQIYIEYSNLLVRQATVFQSLEGKLTAGRSTS